MKSKRPTAYPRSVGNVALAEIVEGQPVWLDSAIDYPSDPSRDNLLSAATWILMGIGLSALLWGLITLLLYGFVT
jgi:hypothetical protein